MSAVIVDSAVHVECFGGWPCCSQGGNGCVSVVSILVMWLECRFLDTEVDGSIPGISMLYLEHDTQSALLKLTQL